MPRGRSSPQFPQFEARRPGGLPREEIAVALRNRSVVGVAFVAFTLLVATSAFAQFPGGFVELATSVDVRPPLTQVQVDALLPSRGLFTFPAPYLTQGVRLTNASDCDGGD